MKTIFRFAAMGLLTVILLMAIGCKDKNPGGGDQPGEITVGQVQIVTTTDTLSFLPGDSASTTVNINVRGIDGAVLPGVRVNITLENINLGLLEYTDSALRDTTNAFGRVEMVYRTYGQAGTNVITASVGGLTDTKTLVVRQSEFVVSNINVRVGRTAFSVAPDGEDSTQVTVDLTGQGGAAIPNTSLTLYTTGGRHAALPPTDANGRASTTWYTNNQFGTFRLWVRAGGLSDTAYVEVTEAAGVSGTLTISSSLRVVPANDCVTPVNISATLKDQDGVAIANDTVRFATPFEGAVQSFGITNSLGRIDTILFCPGSVPCEGLDSAVVIARYQKPGGINLTAAVNIWINPASRVNSVNISTGSTVGTAGLDSASIRADVFYEDGSRVSGYYISFVKTCGLFSFDSLQLSNGGLPVPNYWHYCDQVTSASNPTEIYAVVNGVQSNTIQFTVNPGGAYQILVGTSTNVAQIGETVEVAALVRDSLGNPVRDGEFVAFTSSLGTVADPNAVTGTDGYARTVFNPGTTAGQAVIRGQVGLAVDSTVVTIASGTANTISLDVSSTSLVVRGTGGQDWTQLLATVYDANGNPVPNGQWVTFEIIDCPADECNINDHGTIDSAQTSNGLAVATLNSGSIPGPVNVEASTIRIINDVPTRISARKGNISIVAGPPASMDIAVNQVGLDAGGSAWDLEVSVLVRDLYNNPVQDGIAVFLEVLPDTAQIVSDSVFTGNDDLNGDARSGLAYSILRYLSPATFQTVLITARTAAPSSISETIEFVLPLQDPEIDLICTPRSWHFGERGNPTQIRCEATVKDGHDEYINGATVVYQAERGILYTQATGGVQANTAITGEGANDNGKAVLWLRAQLNFTFPDALTPEITGEVRALIDGYPAATDAEIILFRR